MLSNDTLDTNPTASIAPIPDPMFDSALANDTYDVEGENRAQDIKTEEDSTNNGHLGIQQLTRREAQQQNPTVARPGHQEANQYLQCERAALRVLQPAPVVGAPIADPQRPQGRAWEERPCTPPNQTDTCQFPVTPDTSPELMYALSKEILKCRTADSSPIRGANVNISICINPSQTMRRTSSYPNGKEKLEKENHHQKRASVPSLPASVGLAPPPSFPLPESGLMDMSTLNMEFLPQDVGYDSSFYSPLSTALSPRLSSFESSPEMTNMTLFDTTSDLTNFPQASQSSSFSSSQSVCDFGVCASPSKAKSHRRTQSAATIDLDAINEETGITEEQIAMYMIGPLADDDNRYLCTYESCNKLFGRKENIKSHIQTHLNDRKWRCNHCQKKFVRQHDLKRHAKIHTGEKSHQCLCGQPFLRRDALTRHRQRNMCAGGFGVAQGTPQSPSKRGRPKKRPDMEERMDKATRTRQKVLDKSSASSRSGSSDYSLPSPELGFKELTTSHADEEKMASVEPYDTEGGLSPEFMQEVFKEMRNNPSPFLGVDGGYGLFGADLNPFDLGGKSDSSLPWFD